MKSILVATDGSPIARKAVKAAAEMAKSTDAKLTIINVQDHRPLGELEHFAEVEFGDRIAEQSANQPQDITRMYGGVGPAEVADVFDRHSAFVHRAVGEAILVKASREAKEAGADDAQTIATVGDAAQEIVDAAKRLNCDLIVVGSHGIGGLSGLLGSVSRKVLHHAPANVLTVF